MLRSLHSIIALRLSRPIWKYNLSSQKKLFSLYTCRSFSTTESGNGVNHDSIQLEINSVVKKIDAVEEDIRHVEKKLEALETKTVLNQDEKETLAYLRKEKADLRKEKAYLSEEKADLRKKADLHASSLKIAEKDGDLSGKERSLIPGVNLQGTNN